MVLCRNLFLSQTNGSNLIGLVSSAVGADLNAIPCLCRLGDGDLLLRGDVAPKSGSELTGLPSTSCGTAASLSMSLSVLLGLRRRFFFFFLLFLFFFSFFRLVRFFFSSGMSSGELMSSSAGSSSITCGAFQIKRLNMDRLKKDQNLFKTCQAVFRSEDAIFTQNTNLPCEYQTSPVFRWLQ